MLANRNEEMRKGADGSARLDRFGSAIGVVWGIFLSLLTVEK